jgi:CheY-like chemotaxis protein
MRPKTILLVDEEPSEYNKNQLERLGYRVLAATDGDIRAYTQGADEIDLIVLDVTRLDLGGRQTPGLIKQLYWEAKILVVTGASRCEHISEAASMGVSAIVRKPYELEELAEVLGRLLD